MNQYRHSGAVPLGGAALTVVVGGNVALILGFVYSWLVHYIPIAYLNILCTVGLGFGLGAAIGKASHWGHLRNTFVVTALAVILSCIAIYVAWASFLMVVFGIGKLGFWSFDPKVIWTLGSVVLEKGTWGVGRGQNNAVTGVALAIVWWIEGGLIIGIAAITARRFSTSRPYCEHCFCWAQPHPSIRILAATGLESYWQKVAEGELIALNQAPVGYDTLPFTVHLDLATCPQCKAFNVLSIRRVARTTDEKGKEKIVETFIAKDFLIRPQEAEFVQICGLEEEESELLDDPPPEPDTEPQTNE